MRRQFILQAAENGGVWQAQALQFPVTSLDEQIGCFNVKSEHLAN